MCIQTWTEYNRQQDIERNRLQPCGLIVLPRTIDFIHCDTWGPEWTEAALGPFSVCHVLKVIIGMLCFYWYLGMFLSTPCQIQLQ